MGGARPDVRPAAGPDVKPSAMPGAGSARSIDRGLFAVLGGFIVYGLIHGVVTGLPGPALALDDVKLNIVTQSLQGGYMPENPPLFEWLLIAVQSATGPTLISFIIVKYFLLTLASGAFYLAARELGADRPWAALTAASLTLYYQIGWNYHQAFTHTTALIAASALFWWAFIRVLNVGRLGDFALLGLAMGLGLLAKYAFIATALAAFAAALRRREARRRLADPRHLLAILIALGIAAPHLAWLLTQNSDVAASMAARLQGEASPYLARIAEGLPAAGVAIVSFFLPAAVVFAALFGRRAVDLAAPEGAPAALLVARDAALIGAGGLIVAVLALGMDDMQERYAVGFLLPAVLWSAERVRRLETPRARARLWIAVAVFAALTLAVRYAAVVRPGPPFCEDCRQWVPYERLAAEIRARGFADADLVGFEDHTAGNLRRLFPHARVLSAHAPYYTPPLKDAAGASGAQCVFIWSPDLGPPPPASVTSQFNPLTMFTVEAPWRGGRGREAGWRTTAWRVAPLDHAPALARSLCRTPPPG